ncbi:MAG: TMEM175 family protein [Gammaproteobacteria bacterium]
MRRNFRLRGAEMSRLETFVDAAFAFALTMLVISFDELPTNYEQLSDALRGIPAFAASFAILVMFWVAHRTWSQRYGLDDSLSTIISLTLVFVIMVYVYPLRSMMATAMSGITNGWAPTDFRLETVSEARKLISVYGIGFAIANLCIVLLNLRALSLAEELALNARERFATRVEITAWSIVGSFGLMSTILVWLLPDDKLAPAAWLYALLAVVMPAFSAVSRRRAARFH